LLIKVTTSFNIATVDSRDELHKAFSTCTSRQIKPAAALPGYKLYENMLQRE